MSLRRANPVAPSRLVASLFVLLFIFTFSRAQAQTIPVGADGYSPLAEEILREINVARARPQEYATYLEQMKPLFDGKQLRLPGRTPLVTVEGVAAVDEAIRFLRATKPLPSYKISKGMCLGANELIKDQSATGSIGHKGTDGSFCEQRVARYGTWKDAVGENISYGSDSARERVLTLIIDDGVANRGHRNRIFSSEYKVAGVACGKHAKESGMCVITFAGGFAEKMAGGGAETKKSNTGNQDATRKATRF